MNIKSVRLVLAFVILAAFAAPARAIEGLPPGTDEVLAQIQRTMYPPWVYGVTLDPNPPAAGKPLTITAEIHNDRNITDDETMAVTLFYSTDGGETWTYADMNQASALSHWSVTLDGFPADTEVFYGFRAEDTTGNIYTDTPCYVTSWPPGDDTCMFDVSNDDPPIDDADQVIPPDFDFQSLRAGIDRDHLYVELKVEGKITDGTVSPVFLTLYGIVVQNPDKGDQNRIVTQGFLGVYAPRALVAGYQPCMTIYMPAADPLFASEYMECATNSADKLWLKISNKQIGPTPGHHVKFLAANGAVTKISPLTGIYYDYTHVSTVAMFDRRFTVE